MMEEIIRLTKDLMRFKSMHSRPEEIKACAEFIEHLLTLWDVKYRRMDKENIPSIFVLPHPDYAPVLLMSHIDVVDAPDALFVPVEREGKLYGRGSVDDKYAAALSLVLLKEHGISGIVWGADGDLSQHSTEEHVNIESVNRLYRILNDFVKRIEKKWS